MATVFAFGVAVVDFVFEVDELPSRGVKYKARAAQIDGGGMAASAAVTISRLGGEAHFGGRIGADLIGDIILSDLNSAGVTTDFVDAAPGGRSSYSTVMVDRDGERQIVNFSGENLAGDAEWLNSVPRHDAFLADTSWPPGLQKTMELAKRHDVPGVVDGERAADIEILSLASHLAFSRQGIMSLTGEPSAVDGIKRAAELFSNWLCVTDGQNGAYIYRNGSIEQIPAVKIEAVNTLGAGDVWHGAFALKLAEGQAEEEAVQFANAAATLRCMQAGGREFYPDRKEVESFLQAGA